MSSSSSEGSAEGSLPLAFSSRALAAAAAALPFILFCFFFLFSFNFAFFFSLIMTQLKNAVGGILAGRAIEVAVQPLWAVRLEHALSHLLVHFLV